jgi:hypothetical protein
MLTDGLRALKREMNFTQSSQREGAKYVQFHNRVKAHKIKNEIACPDLYRVNMRRVKGGVPVAPAYPTNSPPTRGASAFAEAASADKSAGKSKGGPAALTPFELSLHPAIRISLVRWPPT